MCFHFSWKGVVFIELACPPIPWRKCMTWNQIYWKLWCLSGPICLTGSFSYAAFHFLRYKETKNRIRALRAQPCHLIAAFPPPSSPHNPLPEVTSLGDDRARCVPPLHIWLSRLQGQQPAPSGEGLWQLRDELTFAAPCTRAAASDCGWRQMWLQHPS